MNRSPKRFAALLAVPVALFLSPGAPSAQESTKFAQNLPFLMLHRSAVAPAERNTAGNALRDVAARVREAHADFWSMTAYVPAFYEGDVILHVFGASKDSATLQQAFMRFESDEVWQRRLSEYGKTISTELTNEILIPVAGRALSDPAPFRVWRTACVRQDAFAAALALAKKLVDHVNAVYPNVAVSLYDQEIGRFGTLHWFEDHADVMSWADKRSALLRDPAFLTLQDELNALLVEGSIESELLESFAL